MSWVVIVIVVVVLVGAALQFFFEEALDKLADWFFRLVGLETGSGPLAVSAVEEQDMILLTLENRGKGGLKLLAVEGSNGVGQRKHPVPYLKEDDVRGELAEAEARKRFSQTVLGPGESGSVLLKASEVSALDCKTLAILDAKGRSWPVEGYHRV